MGTLLGAALAGGMVAVWPMALAGRVLAGYWRDVSQILGVAGGAIAAGELMPNNTSEQYIAALASAGVAFLLYAIYEWIVAAADAAKTVVISRHTGRRLPPI